MMETKSYFERKKPRRHKGRSSLLVSAAAFILLATASILWRPALMGGLWSVLAPLQSVRHASATSIGALFSSKISLANQNAALVQQLAALQARVADRDELYRENLALKQELGRPDAQASSTVLAAVLSAPPQVPYDTLHIDAGSAQGIAIGDEVFAGGAVIGIISLASYHSAEVTLFSSSNEQHQGLLNGSIPVTVIGDGEGALSASVPADTQVLIGDAIVFPGIAGGVSETVASVGQRAGGSFKTLHLHLPVNISQLQFVEVHRGVPSHH